MGSTNVVYLTSYRVFASLRCGPGHCPCFAVAENFVEPLSCSFLTSCETVWNLLLRGMTGPASRLAGIGLRSLSRKGFLSGLLSPLDSPLSVYTIQQAPGFVKSFYHIFLKRFSTERTGGPDTLSGPLKPLYFQPFRPTPTAARSTRRSRWR